MKTYKGQRVSNIKPFDVKLKCKYCNAEYFDEATLHLHEGLHEMYSSINPNDMMENRS